jgi:hypothetical protein
LNGGFLFSLSLSRSRSLSITGIWWITLGIGSWGKLGFDLASREEAWDGRQWWWSWRSLGWVARSWIARLFFYDDESLQSRATLCIHSYRVNFEPVQIAIFTRIR